jgi:hypothetical protein
MSEKDPGTRTGSGTGGGAGTGDGLVNPQAVGRDETEATIRRRASRGTDLDPDEIELSSDRQTGDLQASMTDEARREQVAEESETYSPGDLRVEGDEVTVRDRVRRQRAAQGTVYEPDELEVTDEGVEPKQDPGPEATRVILRDDDPRGDIAWVSDDGRRIDTGEAAGGQIYSAYVDVPDREGEWRLQVGGETVESVDVGPGGAERDAFGTAVPRGWNGNVISVDASSGTGTLAQEERDPNSVSATADSDVVAGEGAAEALQAGAEPEQLSPTNPIDSSEGERIAEALRERQSIPSGNPARRGTEANTQLRERVAEGREFGANDVDIVAASGGLRARIEPSGREIDPGEVTQRARDRGVGEEPDALDRLDGDADRGVSITRTAGEGGVVTGAPDPERELNIETGDADRGVGITRGPEGTTVVRPEQTAADVTQFSQQQLDAQRAPSLGDVRASVNRFGQQQLNNVQAAQSDERSEPPLVEPDEDFSAAEIVTGQAAAQDPQFEEATINDALGTVGLEEQLGFREPRRGQADPIPDEGDSAFRFARGAGPRRQFRVESETAGDAITGVVSNPRAQAAALAGVAAPEPATTLGGAALLATGAVAAASTQSQRDVSASPFTDEVNVPEEQSRSELEAPRDPTVTEVEVPEGQQTVSPSELGVPEEAFQSDETGEVPVDVSGGAEINEDGEIELPAEASGVVVYRNRDEEEEDEEDEDDAEEDEEEEDEEEVVVEVPDEFVPDEEVTIGGDTAEPEEQQIVEPEAIQGQDEAEPDDEQADEEFDEERFRTPRQGQQSDAPDPERTRAEEDQPPTRIDEQPGISSEETTDTSAGEFGGIGLGPSQDVTGIVGADDDDRLATGSQTDATPFSGNDTAQEPSLDSGVRPRTASRQDLGLDAALESGAALGSLSIASVQATTQSPAEQTSQLGQQQTPAEQTPSPEEVFDQPRINDPNSPTNVPRFPGFDLSGDDEEDVFGFSATSDLFDSGIVGDPFGADVDEEFDSGLGSGSQESTEDIFEVDGEAFGGANGLGDVDIDTSGGFFDMDS